MGLSSRKEKQRIPADPRNLTWADDAAKFGTNYLSKFGWDSSKGLGVDGDGRKSHIKVSHKLDMLGIGAAHQKDPNGIAWKQNKDFENLLKRLNESKTENETGAPIEDVEVIGEDSDTTKGERKRKRKRDQGQEKAKSKRKKKNKDEDRARAAVSETLIGTSPAADTPPIPQKPYVPRHRAHRARAIASKNIASKSPAAIAEILGIAITPSTSTTPSGSATPQGKLTPLDDGLTIEKITTSTKSVADYFKDKLLAKSSKSSADTSESQIAEEHDSYGASRRGLGSSHLRHNTTEETLDTETRRIGISKFSSLISSSFLAATVSTTTFLEGQKMAPHVEPSEDDIVAAKEPSEVGHKQKQENRTKELAPDAVDNDKKVVKEERRLARVEKRALKEKKCYDSDKDVS